MNKFGICMCEWQREIWKNKYHTFWKNLQYWEAKVFICSFYFLPLIFALFFKCELSVFCIYLFYLHSCKTYLHTMNCCTFSDKIMFLLVYQPCLVTFHLVLSGHCCPLKEFGKILQIPLPGWYFCDSDLQFVTHLSTD